MLKIAILSSHPIQYHAVLFRELARVAELKVFFAHQPTPQEQARAGFHVEFNWDTDLTSGYSHSFLENVSASPGTDHFFGCDTPSIANALQNENFDSLILFGWHLKSFLQGLFAARKLSIPVLVRGDSQIETPRSVLKKSIKEMVYPSFLGLFNAILYVGARSKQYFEHYNYPKERLFFSPHCVDNKWFGENSTEAARTELRGKLRISDDVFLVLFAGKLRRFKRPTDIIDAASFLRNQGLKVEVIAAGDGDLRASMISKAEGNRVPLHMLGFCNQSRMPKVYAASDCLVLPSNSHETWGLVANEALAAGKPIIVSDACGCAEDLSDGAAGRRFKVGDIADLARTIESVIISPPKLGDINSLSNKYSPKEALSGILSAVYFNQMLSSAAKDK